MARLTRLSRQQCGSWVVGRSRNRSQDGPHPSASLRLQLLSGFLRISRSMRYLASLSSLTATHEQLTCCLFYVLSISSAPPALISPTPRAPKACALDQRRLLSRTTSHTLSLFVTCHLPRTIRLLCTAISNLCCVCHKAAGSATAKFQ